MNVLLKYTNKSYWFDIPKVIDFFNKGYWFKPIRSIVKNNKVYWFETTSKTKHCMVAWCLQHMFQNSHCFQKLAATVLQPQDSSSQPTTCKAWVLQKGSCKAWVLPKALYRSFNRACHGSGIGSLGWVGSNPCQGHLQTSCPPTGNTQTVKGVVWAGSGKENWVGVSHGLSNVTIVGRHGGRASSSMVDGPTGTLLQKAGNLTTTKEFSFSGELPGSRIGPCKRAGMGLAKGLAWALPKGTKDSQGTDPWTTGSPTAGLEFQQKR